MNQITNHNMKETPLIWIIDDDDISKFVMKRNLKELGILDAVGFPDSVQPLDILSDKRSNHDALPDIIFLDLNMPILNGFQFLEKFKSFSSEMVKKIHIYMLTSSMNDDDQHNAISQSEISAYFIKPLKLSQLAVAIEKVSSDLKQV